MGIWDRVRGLGPGGYRDRAARRLEREGDLSSAIEAYLDAELPDEAARVLMLRGDAEPVLDKRMAFFEQAGVTAKNPELVQKAKGRRAKLAFDLVKEKGASARSEISVVAAELEAAGEFAIAAEAYILAGDSEGEIRALTSAGAIDKLEERLQKDAADTRAETQQGLALRRMQDLDRGCERRAALRVASEVTEREDRIDDLARQIRQRLVRGPIVNLAFKGKPTLVAFGDEVTVGRGEATIVLSSRSISRVHLAVRRGRSGPIVEDLGTRNGTFLRGARLGGAIPVGEGVELKLGTDLPCRVEPHPSGGVRILAGGATYVAPLGPLSVGPFSVHLDGKGGDPESWLVLESAMESPAYRGQLALAKAVELCFGDEIAEARGGEPVVAVVASSGAT